MKTAAVIAEFNPFHLGHAWLLEKAREAGAERIIVLMSGDYVQRGAPALADRHARAEMALLNGADLVIACPTRYAVSSAEHYARHTVGLLDRLHMADCLVFGSEEGEITRLQGCADVLLNETPAFREALKTGLKNGLSFPAARARALPEYRALLSHPNNILAVEYLKALRLAKSEMVPVTFARQGRGYHDPDVSGSDASATGIRKLISGQEAGVPSAVREAAGESVYRILLKEAENGGFLEADDYSVLLASKLFRISAGSELTVYPDISEDLALRIFRMRNQFSSFTSFAECCAAKSVPAARVMRALLHIALDMKKEERYADEGFIHVLGFRMDAAPMLKVTEKRADLPLITNPPAYRDRLSGAAAALFEEELYVSNLYNAVRSAKSGAPFRNEITKPLVIL